MELSDLYTSGYTAKHLETRIQKFLRTGAFTDRIFRIKNVGAKRGKLKEIHRRSLILNCNKLKKAVDFTLKS